MSSKTEWLRRASLVAAAAVIVTFSLAYQPAAHAPPPAARKPTKTPVPTSTSTPTFLPSPTSTASQDPASLLIYALYYDTYTSNEPEEAFELINLDSSAVDLSGWQATDGEGTVTFPSFSFQPGQRIWVTKTATTFRSEFGFSPDFEYGGNSDASVADMTGTAPTFANSGDEFQLLDASNAVVDAGVWRGGDTARAGWSGAAINP